IANPRKIFGVLYSLLCRYLAELMLFSLLLAAAVQTRIALASVTAPEFYQFYSGRFHLGAASAKIECEFNRGNWRFMALKQTKNISHGGKRVSEILEAHERFFSGREHGIRADLSGADLSGAD